MVTNIVFLARKDITKKFDSCYVDQPQNFVPNLCSTVPQMGGSESDKDGHYFPVSQ